MRWRIEQEDESYYKPEHDQTKHKYSFKNGYWNSVQRINGARARTGFCSSISVHTITQAASKRQSARHNPNKRITAKRKRADPTSDQNERRPSTRCFSFFCRWKFQLEYSTKCAHDASGMASLDQILRPKPTKKP